VSDLTPTDLALFEEHLRAQATHEESVTPYTWIGSVVRLLRWLARNLILSAFPWLSGRGWPILPMDQLAAIRPVIAIVGASADALRAAALKDIPSVTERLTVQCEQQLVAGRDPEVHGWRETPNVVWHICPQGSHSRIDPSPTIDVSSLRRARRNACANVSPQPHAISSLFWCFGSAPTDIAIEKSERICTPTASRTQPMGQWEIRYLKRRAHPQEWKTRARAATEDITTPAGSFAWCSGSPSVHGPTLQRRSSGLPGRGKLYFAHFSVTPEAWSIERFVADHDFARRARASLSLSILLRLRKTRRAERYMLGHGPLEVCREGCINPTVAGIIMRIIPALRTYHEAQSPRP